MREQIQIKWCMTKPPAPAVKSFYWQNQDLIPHHSEKLLSWPSGTLDFLGRAFEGNLDRFTSWNLDKLDNKEAAIKAATVFRRGVGIAGKPIKSIEGAYQISAVDQAPPLDEGIAIIDRNVANLWGLKETRKTLLLDLDETSKSLDSVAKITRFLNQFPTEEKASLVGGGVLTDTAAFACAQSSRDFSLIPTTLLSMADACVGGKTGVNFPPYGKNQVGLFAFPTEVIIYPRWLETLSQRDLKAGLAECYKHYLISANESIRDIYDCRSNCVPLHQLIDIISVKSSIVARDPGEVGERALLNLGHTLAHALEAISHSVNKDIILHGEAVGLGLLFTVLLSRELGHLSEDVAKKRIEDLFQKGLILKLSQLKKYLGEENIEDDLFVEKLYSFIAKDKKSINGSAMWVLLTDEGCYTHNGKFTYEVSKSTFLSAYSAFANLLSQPLDAN